MANENENLDSLNETGDQAPDENLETTDDVDALKEKNRQLFERAKKAETELKGFKSKEKPASESGQGESAGAPREREQESPDYAEKFDRLTIRAEGIKDSDQIDFVIGAAKRLGESIEKVLTDPLVMDKVKEMQEGTRVKDAVPSGSKRTPQSSPKQSVDYWVEREDLPEDYKLRKEVVLERKKRSKSATGLPIYR